MNKTVLILGATSSIARAIAAEYARAGYSLFLAARDEAELQIIATDLNIRFGVNIYSGYFAAEDYASHAAFLQKAVNSLNGLSGVVLAFGEMGADGSGRDVQDTIKIINTNFTGAVSILNHCASYLAQQGSGCIVGISSVAGDRGRASNYIYGAAKSGLSTYLQGLRNFLYSKNVHVLTVKPGFVDTRLTYAKAGLFLVATPEYIAKRVLRAVNKRKDIIYLPSFWRFIMLGIKLLPEKLFKRLQL